MPYAIEIRFDQQSESRIREIWQQSALFYGSGYLLKNAVIPHVALVVGDEKLETVFSQIEIPTGKLHFSGISFFQDGLIAFLSIPPTAELARYQSSVYQAAIDLGATIAPHYQPDRWHPHCTIAQHCTQNQNAIFGDIVLDVTVRSLILVHYPPTSLIGERMTNEQPS